MCIRDRCLYGTCKKCPEKCYESQAKIGHRTRLLMLLLLWSSLLSSHTFTPFCNPTTDISNQNCTHCPSWFFIPCDQSVVCERDNKTSIIRRRSEANAPGLGRVKRTRQPRNYAQRKYKETLTCRVGTKGFWDETESKLNIRQMICFGLYIVHKISSCLPKSTSRVQFSPSAHPRTDVFLHKKLIRGTREGMS